MPHPWHTQDLDTVFELQKGLPNGLPEQEASARLEKHGPNALPKTRKKPLALRFLLQFNNILIYVLLVSAAITLALQHHVDALVILAVVLVNAVIGVIQEGKAEKAMEAIRDMLSPQATVLREGTRKHIKSEAIVPGDIVYVKAGDRVPADIRLFDTHGLQIQEAILTGESEAVSKSIAPAPENAALGDRTCMAYSGTLAVSGQGTGIVVATGKSTEIGHISKLLSKVKPLTTPLVTQMGVFAKLLTGVILTVAGILFAYGYFWQDYNTAELFMMVVGLSVAAIPEGLPAVLTITLAVGVQAMARRNAIIRRLPAIETVGALSVICSDKTGTLTRNEMMVASAITSAHAFTLDGNGYAPTGMIELGGLSINGKEHPLLCKLAEAAAICNDSALNEIGGTWTPDGDPTEVALLTLAAKTGIDTTKTPWTRTDEIPFDAKHRFMATLNHDRQGTAAIFVKGAPEVILEQCYAQQEAEGGVVALEKSYWENASDRIASQGQRVLAIATRPVDPGHTVLEHSDLNQSLILLGIVGVMDPPRKEAISSIKECKNAGIAVKMITGDHAKTAVAIGKQLGLTGTVITGHEIESLDHKALKEAVLKADIFARMSPEHKLRLVMALQSHGLTVAMTGDGVNDAPALKRADAGIAMGKSGSEAAKEAAELVLADDNFASIVAAVREGRTVYDNLKKVISWTLPTNAGEGLTVACALLLGMVPPITPVQILWINMITAVTLGIGLAFEPTEAHAMQRPPRKRTEALLSKSVSWHILFASSLFLAGVLGIYQYAIRSGHSLELARSMSVNALVVMEIAYLFFIRNVHNIHLTWKRIRGTKIMWLTIAIVTGGQCCITYTPPLQKIFGMASMPMVDALLVLCVGSLLYLCVELEKQIRLRFFA